MTVGREALNNLDLSDVVEHGADDIPTPSPGEILRHEFMEPLDLSANALARRLNVPPNRITSILNNQRSITADTALRLGKLFGTTPEFWLGLQAAYDLDIAKKKNDLSKIKPIAA